MGRFKEPKGIDFVVKSEPWSEVELKEFRDLMNKQKSQMSPEKRKALKKRVDKLLQTQSWLTLTRETQAANLISLNTLLVIPTYQLKRRFDRKASW